MTTPLPVLITPTGPLEVVSTGRAYSTERRYQTGPKKGELIPGAAKAGEWLCMVEVIRVPEIEHD